MSNDKSLYNLELSDKFKPTLEEVKKFIQDKVIPVEKEFFGTINKEDKWALSKRSAEILEDLKSQAKAKGLWNFFLPDRNGEGVNNLDYAYIAAEMGKSPLASEVFNCSAPDTGNMEVLHKYGSEEQKEKWLKPLLNGEIRSAFGMTEPGLASADAKNISTEAVLDGDEWVINGEKFYISGAGDRRCKIMITMVKTEPDAPPRQDSSRRFWCPWIHPESKSWAMQVFGHDACAPRSHASEIRRRPCAQGQHLLWAGPRVRDLPGPARTGPDPSLHAVHRPGGKSARTDVQKGPLPGSLR